MSKQTDISPKIWLKPINQQRKEVAANDCQIAPIEWTETKKQRL